MQQAPKGVDQRIAEALFLDADPSSNGSTIEMLSSCEMRLRTGSGLLSTTTLGISAMPQPNATIDTMASWPPTVA